MREPKPDAASIALPEDLIGEARKIWMEMAPQLRKIGLFGKIDRRHLIRGCRLEAIGVRLLAKAEKKPISTTRSNGRQPSAELTAALKVFTSADQIWFRFGVLPAERVKLTTADGGDLGRREDSFETYRRRNKAPARA